MELDKTKFYISPAKEIVSVYIDGVWKLFIRTDLITKQ